MTVGSHTIDVPTSKLTAVKSFKERKKERIEMGFNYHQTREDLFADPMAAYEDEEEEEVEFDFEMDDEADENSYFGQLNRVKSDRFCCDAWYDVNPTLRYLTMFVVGTILSAIPLAIDALTDYSDYDISNPPKNMFYIPYTSNWVSGWSIWVALLWPVALSIFFIIDNIPIIMIFVGKCLFGDVSESFKGRIQYYIAMEKYAALLIFSAFALITSYQLIPDREHDFGQLVMNILLIFLVFSSCYFGQKTITHFVAINLHRTAYAGRITQVRRAIEILDALRHAVKLSEMKREKERKEKSSDDESDQNCESKSEDGKQQVPIGEIVDEVFDAEDSNGDKQLDPDMLNATIELQSSGAPVEMTTSGPNADSNETTIRYRLTRPASTVLMSSKQPLKFAHWKKEESKETMENNSFPRVAESQTIFYNIRKRDALNPKKFRHESKYLEIFSRSQAKQLAKMLFYALLEARRENEAAFMKSTASDPKLNRADNKSRKPKVKPGLPNLLRPNHSPDDSEFLTYTDYVPFFDTDEDARIAFQFFDRNGNGSISKREMKNVVLHVYKERNDLIRSLRDVSKAVSNLDGILFCVSLLLTLFAGFFIFSTEFNLSDNFLPVFTFLSAFTFVFGQSAQSVFEGIIFLFVTHAYDVGDRVFVDEQNYIVYQLNLLTTVFRRADGQIIYAPNSELSTKFIHNIRRSPSQSESIDIYADIRTPVDTLATLKTRLSQFVENETREFSPQLDFQVDIAYMKGKMKYKIEVEIEHRGNWFDMRRKNTRRTKFMLVLVQTLLDLDIQFLLPEDGHKEDSHDDRDVSRRGPGIQTASMETLTGSPSSTPPRRSRTTTSANRDVDLMQSATRHAF